jgi:predicted secreted protein
VAQVVTRADNGRTVKAGVGEEIVVVLPERATAGYEWMVVDAPPEVEAFTVPTPPTEILGIGADASRRVGLRVKTPGTHRIRLLQYRPWEGPEKAIDSFDLTVRA